jgi:peptidoglycan/LPS O-acetylase OafA/YrhL
MPSGTPRYQINSLTSTRAFAAIMVFIHHFGRDVFPFSRFPSVFTSGNLAVGYFFLLSGFVLYISYYNREVGYSDFLIRRVSRIVPVYEIALLLTIVLAVHYQNYNIHAVQSMKEIGFSAFLVHAFIPSYPLVLNGPGWTISVEMFFYALFPAMLLLQKKSLRTFVAITAVLFVLAQYFHLKYYPQRHALPDNIVDTVFFNPVFHFSQFLLGMIGGYIFTHLKSSVPKLRWLPLALFTGIILIIAYRPENISYHVGLIAPLFLLMIVSIAWTDNKTLNLKPLVYLGEISYGIYILQQPVYTFLDTFNNRHLHIPKQYFFWMALFGLVAVAAASYHLLELPLRKKVGQYLAKRKVANAL